MSLHKKPNILLIAADTLRADRLGCYGYSRDTSPHIDALAAEGVLCERLFCPGIPTHPSFTTLYTGQHPITHGIVSHGGKTQLSRETPVLPELFLQEGYTTCAVDNLWRARLWFGRGYEFYIDPSLRRGLLIGVTCEEINARAISWMRTNAEEPFFMFLHYWDPHYPLNPPERYRSLFYEGNPFDPDNRSLEDWWRDPLGDLARNTWLHRSEGLITDVEYVKTMYDQEIRHLDDGIGELLATLDDIGISEQTLVLFLADHGTSLTENAIFFDHHGLYDCTIHVPLIVRWPGKIPEGIRIPHLLHMSDIAPTLLEAAGLNVPKEMEGHSFWRLLTGDVQEGGHSRVISLECTWQAKWSLRTERYKFILSRDTGIHGGPPRELYDLIEDPLESHNIAETRPEITQSLEAELEQWIADRLRELGKKKDPLLEQGISMKHFS